MNINPNIYMSFFGSTNKFKKILKSKEELSILSNNELNSYIDIINENINNCDKLINKCNDDMFSINSIFENNIKNNYNLELKNLKKINDYYLIFLTNSFKISNMHINNYNAYKSMILQNYKKEFSLNNFNIIDEKIKKFYKLKDKSEVNKGIMWNGKKTVKKYVIEDNNYDLIIDVLMCNYLINVCKNNILSKKLRLEDLKKKHARS